MKTANTKIYRTVCLALLLTLGLGLTLTVRTSRTSVAAASSLRDRQLTFDERVAYQRAIEAVYWRHRIWPAENPGPKPALDAVMSQAEIEARVADYLRKSQALEAVWQRPISGEQLQAEMDRMASETRRPEMLRELYRALGDDPFVVAECLARPTLVERLISNWYAYDERFHGELKQRAERELLTSNTAHQLRQATGEYAEVEWTREGRAKPGRRGPEAGIVAMNAEEWEKQTRRFGRLREDAARYFVTAALEKGKDRMRVAVVEWRKEPFEQWWDRMEKQTGMMEAAAGYEYQLRAVNAAASACADDTWRMTKTSDLPSARSGYTAVWTGAEMIVWGGRADNLGLNTGGRYNPSTNSWTATGANGAPPGRENHSAVWTGTEMIVWGGDNSGANGLNSGGKYNPITNSWTATSLTGAPSARDGHTAVWTGAEMIVWGGFSSGRSNTGGRYNPVADSWTPTALTGAPTARTSHAAVWTGSVMIVWGGADNDFGFTNTGGRYSPATDSWTGTGVSGAPTARHGYTAVWTGAEMIIWGGSDSLGETSTGGRYNPGANTWTATSGAGAIARQNHSAIWTGSEMIVWGGSGVSGLLNTGGRYNPSANSWTATGATGAPSARNSHAAVWTGTEMIVWGGNDGFGNVDTGGRYNPAANTWSPTSALANAPGRRSSHTAVWTGSEMIIWGGSDDIGLLNTGARYDPATDNWTFTSVTGAPTARDGHTAVWTGAEMIAWGGFSGSGPVNTGGRYNPITNSWTATGGAGAPGARVSHTAVWTGAEMIVWGGYDGAGELNTGGRYNPGTNIWTATGAPGAPSARLGHTAVWTGSEMIIWGGSAAGVYQLTGGRYNPGANSWTPVALTDAPSARTAFTAVWSGSEMIVWGGYDGAAANYPTIGARYNPVADSWTVASAAGAPAGRNSHTAIWTGSEMIVWGGRPGGGYLNTGGRYSPAADSWTSTSLTGAPEAREDHTAVWTGSEIIVWGGIGSVNRFNTGGAYCARAAVTNAPPTITGATISRRQGSPASTSQIATVGDANQACNSLSVTATSATGSGVTVSDVSVNASCQMTASVIASCAATNSTFNLTVTDDEGATANALLIVNVMNNTAPSLGTYPATISVNAGAGATVKPDVNPSDNGSVASVTASAPGFTGTLSVNADGVVTIGNAGPAGNFVVSVKATDNCGAQTTTTFSLTVSAACSVTVNPTTLLIGTVGVAYNQTVSATGGTGCSFQVSAGALPTGLLLNSQTGVISGAPTAAGVFNFTIRASCANACTGARAYTVTINPSGCPTITLPALPATGSVGSPYAGSLVGTTPAGAYNFTVTAGSLPPGVTLNNIFKVVSGTPTTAGTYNFTIKATRSGTTCEGVRSYTVRITTTVVPILECVQRNQNGSYTARFGYNNSTGAAVTIPVGANNYFTPGNQNRGQTTVFQPGRVTNAFSVTFTKGRSDNLAIWYLRGPDGVLRPVNVLTTSIGCP